MPTVRLRAILWRLMNKATFDTLAGSSRGQYDIRLGSDPRIAAFFKGLNKEDPTSLGGFTLRVQIEAYEGSNPVPRQTIEVRCMGPDSERKDWYIASQRPDTAYPLWRCGRGAPEQFSGSPHELVLIARDVNGHYHGRWVKEETFQNLPEELRHELTQQEVGVLEWEVT